MFFLICAIMYILTGILYYRQITSIEKSVVSYIIAIAVVLVGIMFFIGFFMGV